jgi:branched-chain amino acid transport system ATP-binding protein
VDFGGVKALDGIDLTLRQGETLGLIGPNGAGKSTLVNVLTGFQRPTRGSVSLDGRDVTRIATHRRAKRGLVRTFQSTRAFAGLTVYENVEVSALTVERSRRAARAWTKSVLSRSGLWGVRAKLAGTLATGDAHRLGFARALALRPRLLLLDEPAAGLNDSESERLKQLLLDIRAENDIGLLVIEHNVDFVKALSHRIQVLDEGRTIGIGTPREVERMPAVLDAYLGKRRSSDAAT